MFVDRTIPTTITASQRVNNFASRTNPMDDDDDIQIFTARKQNISLNANEIVVACEKWVHFFLAVLCCTQYLFREKDYAIVLDWLDFYWLPSYLCMTYNNCNFVLLFRYFNCVSSSGTVCDEYEGIVLLTFPFHILFNQWIRLLSIIKWRIRTWQDWIF